MINATVVKKYLSIGAVAILFILMYKISDDLGKQIAVSSIYFLTVALLFVRKLT